MRLNSLFMFLIQLESVRCNLSGGVGMLKGENCDVGICSSVEEDGMLVALILCWSSMENSRI